MVALLYILLGAVWLEDGLMRRIADPGLGRRPLFGNPAWWAAGAILATTIIAAMVLGLPPGLQSWLDALSLVVVAACLAPADRSSVMTDRSPGANHVRELAPLLIGTVIAISLAAAWSIPQGYSLLDVLDLVAVAIMVALLALVRLLAPALQGRIALAAFAPLRGAAASLATASILALALAPALALAFTLALASAGSAP